LPYINKHRLEFCPQEVFLLVFSRLRPTTSNRPRKAGKENRHTRPRLIRAKLNHCGAQTARSSIDFILSHNCRLMFLANKLNALKKQACSEKIQKKLNEAGQAGRTVSLRKRFLPSFIT
jgi:hypothetical protein